MHVDYLILALKNLKHRGIRSWLTLLGIFIGVTAVVALISLGNGLQMAVAAQFGVSTTEVITVQAGGISGFAAPGAGVTNRLTEGDVRAIEGLPNVEVAIGRNIETFKVEYNDRLVINAGFGVNEGDKRKFEYEILDFEAEKGRLLMDGDLGKVVLGYNYGLENGVGFGKAVSIGDKISVNGKNFQVIGILKKKGSFIFDNSVMMNNADLNKLVNNGDFVDAIAVKVIDSDQIDKTKEDIEKLLRQRRNVKAGEEDFEVSTPEAMLETVNSILSGVTAFIVIIASISIIVGAIGIVNTMTTSVLERKKEIGIMKSIGATNQQVFVQFFFESGLLGLIGGFIGVIFGTLAGFAGMEAINGFIGSELTPNIDFMLIGLVLLGSFVIGSVAGISPAMSAAKQNPVEALRG